MKKGITIAVLLCVFCFQISAFASVWYASPNAAANGDGSLANPWPLQVALTNTAVVQAGDTVYLRGGTYIGGYISTLTGSVNNYITVGGYPGEHAIVTDGQFGTLGTTMDLTNRNIAITNSQNFISGMVISIGSENMQLSATNGSPTSWIVNRGWNGTTNTLHAKGVAVIPNGRDIISHSGSYTIFRDLEITSRMTTNRVATYAYFPGAGIQLLATGTGNKIINCIIHDTGHPGIGFWQQGAGGELNGDIIWGTGQYDFTAGFGGEPRGSAVYSQNVGGMATIKNCITFDNFTSGGKVFGETGPVRDFMFDGNISLNNADVPLEIQSGSTSTTNTWMVNNFMTGTPALRYVSLSNNLEVFTNNVIVNGSFRTGDYTNSTYAYNTVFMTPNSLGDGTCPIQYTTTNLSKARLASVMWDYNNYYLGSNSSAYQWAFTTASGRTFNAQGGGNLRFNNDGTNGWTNQSGFDVHSTFLTNWPPSYLNIKVQPLDYDSNQFHICVISTSGQSGAILNLTNYGFSSGDQYELRDAQNYFTVIQSGTNTNGFITLPLNLTNFAGLAGSVTNFTPQHSNVRNPGLFNAFALLRIPAPPPPPNTNQPPTNAAPNAPLPPTNLHVIDQ